MIFLCIVDVIANTIELGDKNEMMSFVLGFKLGMRLVVEAMTSIDEITEPKIT